VATFHGSQFEKTLNHEMNTHTQLGDGSQPEEVEIGQGSDSSSRSASRPQLGGAGPDHQILKLFEDGVLDYITIQ
jgi:hypothetical protein